MIPVAGFVIAGVIVAGVAEDPGDVSAALWVAAGVLYVLASLVWLFVEAS